MHRLPFAIALVVIPAVATWLPAASEARQPGEPRFTRHVVPLFSRLGCNAGTCHGAVRGKNGFRLSLFGVEPALDHERLVRDAGGRRLNFQNPDASLLLLKATGRVAHEGGNRLAVGSPEYQPACAPGSPAEPRWIPPNRAV